MFNRTERQVSAMIAAQVENAEATGSKITLAQTWHVYLRSAAQELRPGTLASYRGCMRKHVLPALGHLRLAELTRERMRAFIDAELAAGVSPKTVRNSVGVVRSTLGGLVRSGVLPSNPASVVRGWLPRQPPSPKVLTKPQLREFLQASLGERNEDLILFFALTGVRLREALALRWSEVDLGTRTAVIRRALRIHRRNMPTICIGFRTIDLPGPLAAALTRRRRESPDADLVFRDERRSGCVNARELRLAFRRMAKRAGLPPVHPHMLRHTWATLMLDAGVPLAYVSRSLGHHSTAFTTALYASARRCPLPAPGRTRGAAPARVPAAAAEPGRAP